MLNSLMTELCPLALFPTPLRVEPYSGPRPIAESPRVAIAGQVQEFEQNEAELEEVE